MPSIRIRLPNAALCQQTIQANVSLFVDGTIIKVELSVLGLTYLSSHYVAYLQHLQAQAHMFTMLSIQNRLNKLLRPQ